MQDTILVRTSVDGEPHSLVLRRTTDESNAFDPLFDLLPDGDPTDVLAITYEQSETFLGTWQNRIDRRPRNVGVVSAGEQTRSTTAGSIPEQTDRPLLRGVPDATDVEAVRETATRFLDTWGDTGRTVLYFDSLTALCRQTDAETTVEFVETLLQTLDARDAVGYFCLTPAAHDRTVVREIGSRFDTVLECVDNAAVAETEPSVDEYFDAIADAERRSVLTALADGEETTVAALATAVADRTSADAEQAQASLVDVHLPMLSDLGLVSYDRDHGRVAPGLHFERIVPYLRKAVDGDDARLAGADD